MDRRLKSAFSRPMRGCIGHRRSPTSLLSLKTLLCITTVLLIGHLGWSTAFKTPVPDDPNRTRVRTELSWDWGHTWSVVDVNKQPLSQTLSSELGRYRFTLPLTGLKRGLSYVGPAVRLRHLLGRMARARNGTTFNVGVVGGSITWGQGASQRGVTDWFPLVANWMMSAFPGATVRARNGCTPGVPSSYMVMCLELSVDPDVDLVFVEYTLNDGMDDRIVNNRVLRSTERLLRRLLALRRRPAVVLVHVPAHGIAEYPPGHPKNPKKDLYRPYYDTTEDLQGAVCKYYDLLCVSLRSAVYPLALRQVPGFMWEDMMADFHLGDQGHKVVSDLVVHALQQQLVGLVLQPWSAEEAAALGEQMMPPMHEGNYPPTSPMCVTGDNLRSLVVSSQGWEWRDEGRPGKPKVGYVARSPGAVLRLRVDTDRSGDSSGVGGATVPVYLQHLCSYEHMGKARISCVSGCQCGDAVSDAHITERVSQIYMTQLTVSQHKQCEIEVTVLPETSSGEYKFKVTGIVVSDKAGAPDNGNVLVNGAHFGIQQHVDSAQQLIVVKASAPSPSTAL